jgi:hypothetical protein
MLSPSSESHVVSTTVKITDELTNPDWGNKNVLITHHRENNHLQLNKV